MLMDLSRVIEIINKERALVAEKLNTGEAQPCRTLVLAFADKVRTLIEKDEDMLLNAMATELEKKGHA